MNAIAASHTTPAPTKDQIQGRALDHFRGQHVNQILFLQPGANAARRIAVLLRDAIDFLVDLLFADVNFF